MAILRKNQLQQQYTYTSRFKKHQPLQFFITTLANENQFLKFLHWQVPKETFYVFATENSAMP